MEQRDKQCVATVKKANAVKKANKLFGTTQHNFINRSKATILALY